MEKQLISSHSGTVNPSHSLYHTLLLKLSLRSLFLSAKNHIVNINLLYCDFVLLTLMVIVIPYIIRRLLLPKTEALELFSVEKQLISSHSGMINLYHSYTIPCIWITSSLSIFLIILVHALFRYPSFSECHTRKFLLEICSLVVLLVTTGSTTTETSERLL